MMKIDFIVANNALKDSFCVHFIYGSNRGVLIGE